MAVSNARREGNRRRAIPRVWSSSVRRHAEHGADRVAVILQGRFAAGDVITEAGVVATVKVPKPYVRLSTRSNAAVLCFAVAMFTYEAANATNSCVEPKVDDAFVAIGSTVFQSIGPHSVRVHSLPPDTEGMDISHLVTVKKSYAKVPRIFSLYSVLDLFAYHRPYNEIKIGPGKITLGMLTRDVNFEIHTSPLIEGLDFAKAGDYQIEIKAYVVRKEYVAKSSEEALARLSPRRSDNFHNVLSLTDLGRPLTITWMKPMGYSSRINCVWVTPAL